MIKLTNQDHVSYNGPIHVTGSPPIFSIHPLTLNVLAELLLVPWEVAHAYDYKNNSKDKKCRE